METVINDTVNAAGSFCFGIKRERLSGPTGRGCVRPGPGEPCDDTC